MGDKVYTIDRPVLQAAPDQIKPLAIVCRGCGAEIDVDAGLTGDEIEQLLRQHVSSKPHDISW